MSRRGFLADYNSREWDLVRTACENDDTAKMDEALSITAAGDVDSLHTHARTTAIKHNATKLLHYLSEHSVSFEDVWPLDAWGDGHTSKATLEFLLTHGWNINTRIEGRGIGNAKPLLWHVIEDIDMVKWCLEHGASVHPRDQEPLSNDAITKSQRSCEPILERVANYGSVAVFELLRSKGAPLGWRPLHCAVETATHGLPDRPDTEHDTEAQKKDRSDHLERMNMVRHLLDVVKLDVNAPDQPASGPRLREHYGTPICYIPNSKMLERDTRDLTWLLLDRGADPTPAINVAKSWYSKFVENVEAWNAQKKEKDHGKCCVQ